MKRNDVREVIYIGGRGFLPAVSGLAMRTRLTFDYFTRAAWSEEKNLLVPIGQPELSPELAKEWRRTEIKTGPAGRGASQKPTWREAALQLADMVTCRWRSRARTNLLGYLSGLDFSGENKIATFLASRPKALVFLTRSDLLPLVRYKVPGQKWVLDANDSVANLARTYDGRSRLRKSVCLSNSGLCRLLEEAELRAAAQCDAIIAISPSDKEYFGRCGCPEVYLEEQCVEYDEAANRECAPVYDVGFIGSDHEGSRRSALALVEVARDPRVAGLSFAIAGRVTRRLRDLATPQNVILLDDVPSGSGFLADCRVSILLSPQETGTSVKFQEAILSGTTVIANRNAARWSIAKPGTDYLEITDSSALIPLLSNRLPNLRLSPGLASHATQAAFRNRMDSMLGV